MGRLVIIRHCRANPNVEHTVEGRQSMPLTNIGLGQAERLGEYVGADFDVQRIISSNRKRCLQTAEAIGAPIEKTSLLSEIYWGDWEVMEWGDPHPEYPPDVKERLAFDWNFQTPNGDSMNSFVARIDKAIDRYELRSIDDDIAIVSHDTTVKMLITRLLGRETTRYTDIEAEQGSVSAISVLDGGVELELTNYTDQL